MLTRRRFLSGTVATFALTQLKSFAWSASPASQQTMLFGVDYYPDQTPRQLWIEDAHRIAEAGFTNVRIAEFAWDLMEPEPGRYEFGWLKDAIGILHAHGLGVIVGTPSAAPPPWLVTAYPDVVEVDEHGAVLSSAGRRFTCPSNPRYRKLADGIATQMVRSLGDLQGVIGWQIDNELTLGATPRCYCRFCRQGFQQWLKSQYGSLDEINKRWGTQFWSQIYTDFAQIPVPLPSGAGPNPGLALDYYRYQSAANCSFLSDQLAVLRTSSPGRFVTTNNLGSFYNTIELANLYRDLDFVSADNYPGAFSAFSGGGDSSQASDAVFLATAQGHDAMRSAKQGKPFLVMEEQSGRTTVTGQPLKGQLRLWAYQAVAHGAMGINYYRWDTAKTGAEEFWYGLLAHDRSETPGFEEILLTTREMKRLGVELLNASYSADIAMLYDYDSDWAWSFQPGQAKSTYAGIFGSWYRAAAAGRIGIDYVRAHDDLSQYKVLLAPLQYILTEQQANTIRSFVAAGGLFVTGFRCGVKDDASRVVDSPLPGLLSDVLGVHVSDYDPINGEKQSLQLDGVIGNKDVACHFWQDVLDLKGATSLANYKFGTATGRCGLSAHSFGKGKAIYIGAGLEDGDLAGVVASLVAERAIEPLLKTPPGVEVSIRRGKGKEWLFVLNHNSSPQAVTLPRAMRDLLTETTVSGTQELKPYEVFVFEQA